MPTLSSNDHRLRDELAACLSSGDRAQILSVIESSLRAAGAHLDEERVVRNEEQELRAGAAERLEGVGELDVLDHRVYRQRRVEPHLVQMDLRLRGAHVEELQRLVLCRRYKNQPARIKLGAWAADLFCVKQAFGDRGTQIPQPPVAKD